MSGEHIYIAFMGTLHVLAFVHECKKQPGYQSKPETVNGLLIGRIVGALLVGWSFWLLVR